MKLWYITREVKYGTHVSEKTVVGHMTNMADQYKKAGMTNHVHVQLYKHERLVNPTSFIC